MGAVSVVYQQRHPIFLTYAGDPLNITNHPVIIRTGKVDPFRLRIFLQGFADAFQMCIRDRFSPASIFWQISSP